MILTTAHGYMGSVLRERPKRLTNPHVGFNAKVGRLPPSRESNRSEPRPGPDRNPLNPQNGAFS